MAGLTRQRSAAGGGAVLVARFALTAGLNYGFGIALAWLLVPAEYGAASVLLNAVVLAAALLAAGYPWVLARAAARAEGAADPEAGADDDDGGGGGAPLAPVFRSAVLGNALVGVVVVVGLLTVQATTGLVPGATPLAVAALAATVLLMAVSTVLCGALQGMRRFDGLGLAQLGEVVVKVLVGTALVLLVSRTATSVALGLLAGAALSALVCVLAVRDRWPGRGRGAWRTTGRSALVVGTGSAAFAVLLTADLLALGLAEGHQGALGGGAAVTAAGVALYQVASVLARMPYYVGDALAGAVFPYVSQASTPAEAHGWVLAGYRWVWLAVVPVQLVLVLAPGPLLGLLFPAAYAGAGALMAVLTLGTLGLLTTDALVKALTARGLSALVASRLPWVVAAELVLLALAVPRWGLVGAAGAFAVAAWTGALLVGAAYARRHPVRPPRAAAVARYLAALAVPVGLMLLARPQPAVPGTALLLAAGAALVAGYVLLGVLTRAEVSLVAEPLGRLVRRAGPGTAARARPWLLAAACAAVAAVPMLWNLGTAPDTQYDEVVYSAADQSVARSWDLTWTGQPFFVHPPVPFLLQAGWLHLRGAVDAPLLQAIGSTRLLAALAMVAVVVLLALLAHRLAAHAAPRRRVQLALLVAVLAALDPVLVRYGRLAVLEPFAVLAALVALHAALRLRSAPAAVHVAVVGLAGGISLLTNEITVFMLLTPLVAALLAQRWREARASAGALVAGAGLYLLFPLWAWQLGLLGEFAEVKLSTLLRLVGVVQTTGWNRPGASVLDGLRESALTYGSSYAALALGGLALLWLLLHRGGPERAWALALLVTSYGFAAYTVLFGQLNEQFFSYVVPGALVGGVLVGEAVLARRRRRALDVVPLAAAAAVVAVLGGSAASWAVGYSTRNDGVARVVSLLQADQPACAAVNATGDPERLSLTMPERPVTFFATGPGAAAAGVELFVLSDKDAALRAGNASPLLSDWVRTRGTLLAEYPSATSRGLQLWQVPRDARDPAQGLQAVPGGWFAVTEGSRCGGYPVLDSAGGGAAAGMATGWAALGSVALTGRPQSSAFDVDGRPVQVFAGAVLTAGEGTSGPASGLAALPVVRATAAADPAGWAAAGLPPVSTAPAAGLLTDPVLAAAAAGPLAGVLGAPAGPPQAATAADGTAVVRQAFEGAVLERDAGSTAAEPAGTGGDPRDGVRLADLAGLPVATGVVSPPASALAAQAPPALEQQPVARPSSVEPFAQALAVVVAVWGLVALGLVLRERRRSHGRGDAAAGPGGAGGPGPGTTGATGAEEPSAHRSAAGDDCGSGPRRDPRDDELTPVGGP